MNLEVVKIDADRHLIAIKGSVPGAPGGDVIIRPAVKAKKLRRGRHGTRMSSARRTPSPSPTRCSAREFREDLVHQVVVAYRNAGRAGTKTQKSRSDMSGTTKKFKKQKGGGARHGDYRAPIFVGGGRTFAARPRSFAQKVNKKMYRGAFASILSELNRQGRLKVVDSFGVEQPKTKGLVGKLAELKVSGRVVLIVTRTRPRACSWPRATCRTCRSSTSRRSIRSRLVGADHVRDDARVGQAGRGVAGMNVRTNASCSVLRAPHISEKSARLQENNQYVFEVAQDATKADVKAAVEQLFNVKVAAVNVVNMKGKTRRSASVPARAAAGARRTCVLPKARRSTCRPRHKVKHPWH